MTEFLPTGRVKIVDASGKLVVLNDKNHTALRFASNRSENAKMMLAKLNEDHEAGRIARGPFQIVSDEELPTASNKLSLLVHDLVIHLRGGLSVADSVDFARTKLDQFLAGREEEHRMALKLLERWAYPNVNVPWGDTVRFLAVRAADTPVWACVLGHDTHDPACHACEAVRIAFVQWSTPNVELPAAQPGELPAGQDQPPPSWQMPSMNSFPNARNSERLNKMFHTLWTKAVGTPDYVKKEWMELLHLVQIETDPIETSYEKLPARMPDGQ